MAVELKEYVGFKPVLSEEKVIKEKQQPVQPEEVVAQNEEEK